MRRYLCLGGGLIMLGVVCGIGQLLFELRRNREHIAALV